MESVSRSQEFRAEERELTVQSPHPEQDPLQLPEQQVAQLHPPMLMFVWYKGGGLKRLV